MKEFKCEGAGYIKFGKLIPLNNGGYLLEYLVQHVSEKGKKSHFTIKQFGRAEFVDKKNPDEIDIKYAQDALKHAHEIVASGRYDVVILDEINVALNYKLIETREVLDLMDNKPEHMELVLTGGYAPGEIAKHADLVTEMLEIKHPYTIGMPCRRGIDR